MSDVAAMTLRAILDEAVFATDEQLRKIGGLMLEVNPSFWPGEVCREVAAFTLDRIMKDQAIGIATVRAAMTCDLSIIENAQPIESIAFGLEQVRELGEKQFVLAHLKHAEGMLKEQPASEVSSWFTAEAAKGFTNAKGFTHVKDLPGPLAEIDEIAADSRKVVEIYKELNDILYHGGLPIRDHGGETIVVVARSGHGKSSFAIFLCVMLAQRGYPVAYNVLADASAQQIKNLMVFAKTGRPIKGPNGKIDPNFLLPEERKRRPGFANGYEPIRPAETLRERLEWGNQEIEKLPITINDDYGMDQYSLIHRLHHARANGAVLSVFDNLDHIRWNSRTEKLDRRDQLGRIAEIIRQFDKATGHTSLILAQANRASEENPGSIPTVNNIQDSDQVKNHVTLGIGLFNPNKEQGGNMPVKAKVSKYREGEDKVFELPYAILSARPGDL